MAFTFTDWADFGPLAFVVGGTILISLFRRRYTKQQWAQNIAFIALLISIYGFLTSHFFLYLFAKEFEHLTGKMPIPMVNDPKWLPDRFPSIAPYYNRVEYAEAYSGAFSVLSLQLLFALHKILARWQVVFVSLSLVLVAIIVQNDPYHLYQWWID
jgi:hypothetical protein